MFYLLDQPHFQNLTRARTDTVIPMTLINVCLQALEAEARGYGKGLRFLANHNAPCQLANQIALGFSEGGALSTRQTGDRGTAIIYNM